MTWPMHGAGPTTPEPGPDEADQQPAQDEQSSRGRHAAPDPLPPMEGPMLGGGPTPAETTLPLALSWPAPPARPPRTPRFTPAEPAGPDGSATAPPGWRRVGRPPDYPAPGHPQPRVPPPAHPGPGAPQPGQPQPGQPQPVQPQPGQLQPRAPQPERPQPSFQPFDQPGRPVPGEPRGPGPGGPGGRGGRGAPPDRRRAGTAEVEAPTQRSSLVRSGAGMAVGTLVSRGTGFLRTLVLVYAVGLGALGNAYNTANTLPNLVYYLMLGGIFTAVVVPLLVRAAKRDPDRGEAYAQRLFSLGALALLVVTVLATLAAGPLVDLLAPHIYGAEHNLMVVWAYFFIPQIFFYGMSSLIGAVLNTRGRFAAPMWTPVINNLVVIVVGGFYIVTAGVTKNPATISPAEVQWLGIGTTFGVVAQTVALFPSLRGAGFRWRPTLGFQRTEVSEIGRMARWMLVYVVSQSAGNVIALRVANTASAGQNGISAYSIAWQLFQLPYAIVGISVITALLPRMSEHASARRYSLVRDDFSIGVRLAAVIVVPAAIYLGLLGGPLAEFLFSYGSTDPAHARYVGETFGLFSLGLVPYMLTQLQLRVFYSFQDSRTAALVGVLTMGVSIAANYIALAILPHPDVVAGLAVAYGIANLTGTLAGWALLLRRVGSLDGWAIARSLTRMHLATVPGLIFAVAVMIGAGHVAHNPGAVYGLLVTVVGGGGAFALYALSARALRVGEFGFLARTMAARFGGQSGRH